MADSLTKKLGVVEFKYEINLYNYIFDHVLYYHQDDGNTRFLLDNGITKIRTYITMELRRYVIIYVNNVY